MQSNANHGQLALARAKFEPVARELDRLARDLEEQQGNSAVLEQRSPMQQTAENAYSVRYSIRHPDEDRLSLTFVVAGEDADLLLIQEQERSDPKNLKGNPGQVDQHVYHLENVEEIKQAVRQKIAAHFQRRMARH